jgi:hypothetical protein
MTLNVKSALNKLAGDKEKYANDKCAASNKYLGRDDAMSNTFKAGEALMMQRLNAVMTRSRIKPQRYYKAKKRGKQFRRVREGKSRISDEKA